jgi:mannose-6-phosphate isomerase
MAQNKYKIGECDQRPWGSWRVIDCGEGYVVKRIDVNPGASLSLQYHHNRDESWTIIAGDATVTLGERVMNLSIGQTVYIPVKSPHCVENKQSEALVFIEVQMGAILDEADIVRLRDKYGRVS